VRANKGELIAMRITHHHVVCALAAIAMSVAGIVNGTIHAQQAPGSLPLLIGVSGTADVGGTFEGTFFLTRFDTLANDGALVAVGSVDGVLNGRSIVTRVAIPVTLAMNPAQTVGVASPASCDVHVGLERSAFRASGSVVTLARSGIDITAPQAPASTAPTINSFPLTLPATAGTLAAPASGIGTLRPMGNMTSTAAGSAVPTAPVGSAVPGVISPAPQPISPSVASSMQRLGQLVCSASGLSQSGASPVQLAHVLNQVMLALRQ
jgi:hypothetical protein